MLEYVAILAVGLAIGAILAYYFCKIVLLRAFWRKDIVCEHAAKSQVVLKGKIAEQIVSLYPQFKHMPSDARFLGSPIDYVIFDGMSEGKPIDIVFMDVKSGSSRLSANQQKIKDAVESKRVKWETLRVD